MRLLISICCALLAHAAVATETVKAHIATAQGDVQLTLELATDSATRARGLMERKTLAPNDGMLFLFPSASKLAFWMKNTPLPLDMLFLDASGHIVHIAARTTPYSETPVPSPKPAIAVIEIVGGRAARDGIQVGDRVAYRLPAGVHVE
jgi:uncharacterized membrane protein (UPF0127 family)